MALGYGLGLLGRLAAVEVLTLAQQERQLHGVAAGYHAQAERVVAELQWPIQTSLAALLLAPD
jgi:hypothetical protein